MLRKSVNLDKIVHRLTFLDKDSFNINLKFSYIKFV